MTPLVVLDVSGPATREAGARLDIFPGGPTPAVFPADTPFWVGYGFAPDVASSAGRSLDEDAARFELDVDGACIETRVELTNEDGVIVRKSVVAAFPSGLPCGWHAFSGRWYDGERLLLASRADVEFVC